MAIRSPRTATSGPGRAPGSDGRARTGRGHRNGAADAPLSVLTARRRADALFLPPPPGTAAPPHEPASPTTRALGESAFASRDGFAEPVDATDRDEVGRSSGARPGLGAPGVRERALAAVRERLPVWAQTRCGLAPRSLAALCLVLLVAAGFAVHHFWAGRPQSVRAPDLVEGPAPPLSEAKSAGSGTGPARSGGTGSDATPRPVANAAPTPAGALVVDVGGKVRHPGIYRLPSGSRVADALAAAGGVRDGTDLTSLNRARPLMDGEQVLAGVPGGAASGAGSGAGGGGSGGGGGGPGGSSGGPISLNSASVEQLDGLPGVGPVLAQHIVDYRAQHGGFRSVGELREVHGIGARRFNDLQSLVRL
ncbi:ComEA family DNA-binding protein [Streptomyces sp. ASQP_92]|uniref:ComEA family DNA-binding protein n=1 Tax=Streptomyces sp. ASQP_92 TaxID=2979116 RepID=UPI0021BE96D2|nr:ComEA family DNA-binding protein [Streptomyces sp. ASQP_92]MCT9087670.1 ComEA family DNA-binding protein [Streptomyces sp. ASQP_92]